MKIFIYDAYVKRLCSCEKKGQANKNESGWGISEISNPVGIIWGNEIIVRELLTINWRIQRCRNASGCWTITRERTIVSPRQATTSKNVIAHHHHRRLRVSPDLVILDGGPNTAYHTYTDTLYICTRDIYLQLRQAYKFYDYQSDEFKPSS